MTKKKEKADKEREGGQVRHLVNIRQTRLNKINRKARDKTRQDKTRWRGKTRRDKSRQEETETRRGQ
jgi:hypothetical protein